MNNRLEKINRKTTDFIQIEIEGHFLRVQSGKIEKGQVSNSTKHCGTNEKAIDEFNILKQEFLDKKYIEIKELDDSDDFNGVYDKAKWHIGGDFPKELDHFQAYIHTGYYLTWIIEKEFFKSESDGLIIKAIEKVKKREITGAEFFEKFLDGVLLDQDLTEKGNEFTHYYYEKGEFLEDYSEKLCEDLPTLYHIEDNWENYNKLKTVFEKRFKKWKRIKMRKWWGLKK